MGKRKEEEEDKGEGDKTCSKEYINTMIKEKIENILLYSLTKDLVMSLQLI